MRLIFLVLLLGVTVSSFSIRQKIKDFFSGGIAEKLKNVAKEGIRKALNGTFLLKISDAFKKLGSVIKERLTLSPERRAALLRALQARYWLLSSNPRVIEVFEKAAKAWESKTCLTFRKVNYGETPELINVGALGGCFSSVGKTGRPQDLSLGDGCHTVGIAAHEIGHSLGLYHTMGRADRDKYVTVNMDKIRQDYYSEFLTYTVDVDTYGVSYDYGSIMHYGATRFVFHGITYSKRIEAQCKLQFQFCY
ncbi:unnamed protein product [Haemonchus placei]|uniref:Metalloendopeptidase n=1 Tax=Haemonchus placei TaxID=6290 RepID=A0A0N4VX43_HAEPC|nr:unnamed protein product [Haemonchus placei]